VPTISPPKKFSRGHAAVGKPTLGRPPLCIPIYTHSRLRDIPKYFNPYRINKGYGILPILSTLPPCIYYPEDYIRGWRKCRNYGISVFLYVGKK